ncbi:hypothetical protein H7F51_04745 [Novosphingobium flavum]|uniref:Uncharacterized protein n=1 Tax=Novosphingobium flavum TaxID=1778672 RepID=A0A7X1FPZ2_9SPHN|nr:hypothetical protein [Novosphingobium flavum]MBC2664820.1 hypothetical protein [Novosphingobium flavum]
MIKPLVTEGHPAPSLEVGVCAMCLNEILKEEQIALMRYSAEVTNFGAISLNERLDQLARELEHYPYIHRPYLIQGLKKRRSALRPQPDSSAPSAWENEGEAL